jgi:signal transduction histidine kinase/CheY-like chemotaxis protein
MRKVPLQTRLVLIASAAILPLAAVCGIALYALFQSQQAQNEASTLGVARALATAVDGELRLTVAALQTLALTEPLGAADGTGRDEALTLSRAVRASHPEWRGILLADSTGRIVFTTDGNAGGRAQVVERASFDEAVRTGRPVVGTMARGPAGSFAFPVRVPVVRDGTVRFVLTAIVRPESIAAVLRSQRVPDSWAVSVFDANQIRIARTLDDEKWRGSAPSATLRPMLEAIGERREMVGSSTNVDGVRAQTALARLDTGRWTLVLGASVSGAESARLRTMAAYLAGLLASLGLGGFGAWWMSRAITRPMRSLREGADALGRGAPRPSGVSGIAEIDAVAHALESAAVQRAASEAEREELLRLEHLARTAAQAAEQRMERLLDASAQLSRSLEEASTLSSIARVLVPEVADLCRIDLIDRNGRLQRKLVHHFDPVRGAQIAERMSRRSGSADEPGSFPWAIRTGQSFLHNVDDIDGPPISDPGLREFVKLLGIRAGCVVPLIARGRTIGAMAVLQAESNRRFSAEDGALIGELAQRAALALDNVLLLAQAREAQSDAESANRAKDEFLAMLGHELRNPLAPIALALQLMARRDAQAFPREREIIDRQVRHLSRMVDDLLDVSRIVSGKIALSLEQVDLRDVVTRAIELTLPALQARTSMPRLDLPDAPVVVQGDPLRLVQIVCNLLNNAAKFSPAEAPIHLKLQADGTQVALSVADQGVGIPPDLLPHVFERFVQGEQALQRAAGGLGLGLAIAQSLAALHEGRIAAHSDGAGTGSTFTLHLPLFAAQPPVRAVHAPAAGGRPAMNLLLVDDNRDAVNVLAEWLRMEGNAVRVAYSAEEALERLAEDAGDAAVFDIGLPGISGYELARMVRSNPATSHLALVALTGYGRASDRQHALNAGFDDHFAKPADVERMMARLQALVADRRARSGVSAAAG